MADGMRVSVRTERPHPGAQLTDPGEHRITAFATNTTAGSSPTSPTEGDDMSQTVERTVGDIDRAVRGRSPVGVRVRN